MKYKDIENKQVILSTRDHGNVKAFCGAWQNEIITIVYILPTKDELFIMRISKKEIGIVEFKNPYEIFIRYEKEI